MNYKLFFRVKLEVSPLFIMTLLYVIYFNCFIGFLYVFAFVFLHELSHFIATRIRGYSVESIQILPFGTTLKFNSIQGIKSNDEILIALAGPVFNFVMAAFLKALNVSYFFIEANLIIALFNLLPMFPLDGGRILRAFLMKYMSYLTATKFVCKLTRIVAAFLFVLGVWNIHNGWQYLFIAFVFLYIYSTAKDHEYFSNFIGISETFRKKSEISLKGNLRVNSFACLEVVKARDVMKQMLPEYYNIIYVLDNNMHIGYVLTETILIESMAKIGYDCSMKQIVKLNKVEEFKYGKPKG